jgi:phage shock protein PspC (stress-responsive transcriptional regulator)
MKKIININLSGRVIPIEDAAYETLQRYIESLRRYFANEEGRDEIINDIESRVAELMNDRIRRGATAITETDIDEIIASMGRVEDFAEVDAADATTGTATATGAYTTTGKERFRGRLYRDTSDKILGGVCSGIANYLNVDPAIIRLLFAIITFGGFGFGILLYILAWIILPAKNLDTFVGKRLFRNPDDRVIGGVASGLGAYFNIKPWIVRLIFAAPLILNIVLSIINGIFNAFHGPDFPDIFIGSFTGTFILAYIILWIVLPEARSPFEKMEMRGERVDVNRIRQNVQESMGDMGTRMQAWGEEVKESAENLGARATAFANQRVKPFASEVSQTARPVASGLGRAIAILIKAFFLFVVGSIAFGLFVAVLVFTMSGAARPFHDYILNGFWQTASLWGTVIFFVAVPLIAVLVWLVRRVMKVRSQNRYLGWVFGGLWTLGWICLFFFASSIASDFRYKARTPQSLPVTQPGGGRMLIRVDEPEVMYTGTFGWFDGENEGWDLTDDSLKVSNIQFTFDRSSDSLYHVTIWKQSRGRNRGEANQRARQIVYSGTSIDSALVLGSGYGISKEAKFRDQRVMVEIHVPVGKRVRFDDSVREKLNPYNIRIREDRRWGRRDIDVEWDEYDYFEWKPNVDYIMTDRGELVEAGFTTRNSDGTYEYTPPVTDTAKLIEEQRLKVEEEQRKLRELEEKKTNTNTTKIDLRKKTRVKSDLIHFQMPSPVFSLIM